MLAILSTLILGLVIGFCAGAAARDKIVKRQPARAHGKLSVKVSSPAHLERCQMTDDVAPAVFEDLAPIDERAFTEGEEAGLRGDTLNNPYDLNSDAGRLYADGWHSGQTKLFEGIKKHDADELIKGAASEEDPFEDERPIAAE